MKERNLFQNPIVKGMIFLSFIFLIFSATRLPAEAGFFSDVGSNIKSGVSGAGSYFSEGVKTFGQAADEIGQNVSKGFGKVGSNIESSVTDVGLSFSEGVKTFGRTVDEIGAKVSEGYDTVVGKVSERVGSTVQTVKEVLPSKSKTKPTSKTPAGESAKTESKIINVGEPVAPSAPAAPSSAKEEPAVKKSLPSSKPTAGKVSVSEPSKESVQKLLAGATSAVSSGKNPVFETIKSLNKLSVGEDAVIDAAGVATLKGLKVLGTVDFTGANVKGLQQTIVNTYTAGAAPPMVVYNTTTKENENWQMLAAQTGGVSNAFSVGTDLTVSRNATVLSGLTIGSATANGSLTVNGNGSFSGTATFSGAATLSSNAAITGNLTVNGNTTLGDAAGDTITVTGRLSTLNISDGSTTSSLAKDSFYLGDTAGNGRGVFYIDSSGNVSASGTLGVFGAATLSSTLSVSGHLTPGSDNLYDIGASSTQWRYGNFQGGLLVANGSTTSTLLNNSFISGQTSGYNLGKFYIDSSGNVSASGTLAVIGATTLTGALIANDAVTLGDAVGDSITVTGKLGTIYISDGSTTSTHAKNSLTIAEAASFNLGKFYIDPSGNVSASGTLAVFGNTSLGDSDAAAGDTTRVYGALGLGLNPTGSALLTIQATSSVQTSKFFEIKDIGGTAMAYFSTSTASYTKPDKESISLKDALWLTLGNSSHPAVLDLTLDSSSYGGIMIRNTSGMILSTLDATTLEVSDALGTVTSTFDAEALTLGMTSGYNQGVFYVDGTTGDIFASGTILKIPLATNITGNGVCIGADGTFTNAGASACVASSLRYKHDITSLLSGLDEVMKLNPVEFKLNETGNPNNLYIGLIAEEVDLVDKRLVDYDSQGLPTSVRYMNAVALAVKAIQEQQKQIEKLKAASTLQVAQDGSGQLIQTGDLNLFGRSILNVKSISGQNGLWSIDENGKFTSKEVKAEKSQAKQFIIEKDSDQKKSTVGEATIKLNNQSVLVENDLVTPKVKIFITFRNNPKAFWWISQQTDGKFEVSLSMTASEDIVFDYWLVGVEENIAEPPAAPPVETPAPPVETPALPAEPPAGPPVENPAPAENPAL